MPVVDRLRVVAEAEPGPLERGFASMGRSVEAFEARVVAAGRQIQARLGGAFQGFSTAGIRSIGDVSAGLSLMGEESQKARQNLDGLARAGDSLSNLGTRLTVGVTLPIVAAGTASVLAATRMDSLRRGLTAVTGSSGEAASQMARLADVARLPGLGFREAIQGSVRLQAAGFSAQEAEASLRAFGNALATVGAGKAELDAVTRALTQIISKGKVSAEEINQIAEVLPQVRVAMQGAFGTANTEAIQRMGLEARTFVAGLTAELGKLEQVSGGPANDFENFADAAFRAGAALGERMLPAVTSVLDGLAAFAERASTASGAMLDLGIVAAASFAAMPVGILLVGQLTTAFVGLNTVIAGFRGGVALTGLASLLAPGGILVGGLAATAGAAYLLLRHLNDTSDAAREAGSALEEAATRGTPGARELADSWETVRDNTVSAEAATRRFIEAQRELANLPRPRASGLGGLTGGGFTPSPDRFDFEGSKEDAESLASVGEDMRRAGTDVAAFVAHINLGVFTTSELRQEIEATSRRIREMGQDQALAGTAEDFAEIGTKIADANRQLALLQSALARQENNAAFDKMARDGEALGRALTQAERKARDLFDAIRSAPDADKLDAKGQDFGDLEKRLESLPRAAKGVKDIQGDMESLAGSAQSAAIAFVSQAHSLDAIDDAARNALTSVVNLTSSTGLLVQGLKAAQAAASGLGGVGGIGAGITGIVGIVGSVANLIASLTSDPGAQLRMEVQQANTAALRRLTDRIGSLNAIGGLAGNLFDGVAEAAARAAAVPRSQAQSNVPQSTFDYYLRQAGISMAEAAAVAEAFGITLDGSVESFRALEKALQTEYLDQWLNDFGRQMSTLQARFDILDITDPADQLDHLRDVFLRFADLGIGAEKALAGVDLGTAGGRAKLENFLIDLMDQILAGNEEALAQLGDMTPEEFIEFVRQFENLGDELGDAATGAARVLQGSINEIAGFKTRLDRLRFDAMDAIGEETAAFFAGDLSLDPDSALEDEMFDLREEVRALREQMARQAEGTTTGTPSVVFVQGMTRESIYAAIRSVISDNAQANEIMRQLDAYLPARV